MTRAQLKRAAKALLGCAAHPRFLCGAAHSSSLVSTHWLTKLLCHPSSGQGRAAIRDITGLSQQLSSLWGWLQRSHGPSSVGERGHQG